MVNIYLGIEVFPKNNKKLFNMLNLCLNLPLYSFKHLYFA